MEFGKIDFTQASTIRGAVWCIAAIIGVIFSLLGRDPSQVIVLASGIAGGLGVAIKD